MHTHLLQMVSYLGNAFAMLATASAAMMLVKRIVLVEGMLRESQGTA